MKYLIEYKNFGLCHRCKMTVHADCMEDAIENARIYYSITRDQIVHIYDCIEIKIDKYTGGKKDDSTS